MSWQKVEMAFHVFKDGKYQPISIGVCDNCDGVHIPAEEANACEYQDRYELSYEKLKEKFDKQRKGKK